MSPLFRTADGSSSTPTVMSATDAAAAPNMALTRENLEGIIGGRPDSIKDKMARYENSASQAIEMLTGLRYSERGEESLIYRLVRVLLSWSRATLASSYPAE